MFRAIKSTVKEHHRWIITAAGCMAIGSSQDAVYADVCIPPLSKSDFKKKYQVEREIGFGGEELNTLLNIINSTTIA